MKWVWIVVSCLVVLCGGCGVGGYLLYSKGKGMMDGAKAYGDASLTAITQPWNAQALIDRAAPELIQQNPEGTLAEVVKKLQVLGPMKSFKSSVTNIRANSSTEAGSYIQAEYQADVVFEKGAGRVVMTLIQRGSEWKILVFRGSQT